MQLGFLGSGAGQKTGRGVELIPIPERSVSAVCCLLLLQGQEVGSRRGAANTRNISGANGSGGAFQTQESGAAD